MSSLPTKPRVLFGILLLGLVVRAVDLNGQSLFVDEVSEMLLAKKSVSQIIFAADSMPPLYPILLKSWIGIWRTDDAARWFSVICGVASIVCVWGVARRLAGDGAALAAAFVTALLPMHVYYSQFVRCYALMFLLAALALWLLLRATELDRWRDWMAFATVTAIGAYNHYYFALFATTSIVIVWHLRRDWRIGWRAVSAYALIGVAVIPLFVLLVGDLKFQHGIREARPMSLSALAYTYYTVFSGYALGPAPTELQVMTNAERIRAAAPWLLPMGVVALVLGWAGIPVLQERRALPIVTAVLFLPVILAAAISLAVGVNYNARFVTWIMIAAAIWMGAGLAGGWNKWYVQIAAACFVLLSAIAIFNRHTVPIYENEDFRGAAGYLAAHAEPSQTIFVSSDYLADVLRYYMIENRPIVELPVPGATNNVVATQGEATVGTKAVRKTADQGRSSWLVYSRAFHGDPNALLWKSLTTSSPHFELVKKFNGVAIYRAGDF